LIPIGGRLKRGHRAHNSRIFHLAAGRVDASERDLRGQKQLCCWQP